MPVKHETQMNIPLYEYSLWTALPLMIFFGAYFLLARTPDKAIFDNYLRSRRIMGCALLLLSANYAVHLFTEIRLRDIDAAILMNLSTYFLCYWLFSSALTTLLDRFYVTRRRMATHLAQWLLFTLAAGIILKWLPEGATQKIGLLAMAAWLVCYGLTLARRLIKAYRRAVRLFDDTLSDDIAAYIRWLSIFTYWAVIFGVGCGLLTFLPDRYIFLWVLSSIPFYVYLFCSYMNYLLFYEQVERALEADALTEPAVSDNAPELSAAMQTSIRTDIATRLEEWIAADGYTRPGLTITDVANDLLTNRTYLSGYINTTYDTTFREWITRLRIEYAKRLLLGSPELTVQDVSERSGFQSTSHFIRIFKERTACPPAKWRKSVSE